MNRVARFVVALAVVALAAWGTVLVAGSGWPVWSVVLLISAGWLVTLWTFLFCIFCWGRMRPVAVDTRLDPTPPEEYQRFDLGSPSEDPGQLYLDLVKRTVTNLIYEDVPLFHYGSRKSPCLTRDFDLERRVLGEDVPTRALTMVGLKRLEQLQQCIDQILDEDIPGDLIETGSFLGGATIFMRAVLKARQIKDRRVIACDTFVTPSPHVPLLTKPLIAALASIPGKNWQRTLFQWLQKLPAKHQAFPHAFHPSDDWVRFTMWALRNHAVIEGGSPNSLELVRSHFARFGLLDDQIVFLKGFFSETLAAPPFEQLSLIRLDGDTYESTRDAIVPLYDKLSDGGFCVVDDYHAFDDCRRAIDEFRADNEVQAPIVPIDNMAVFWRKI